MKLINTKEARELVSEGWRIRTDQRTNIPYFVRGSEKRPTSNKVVKTLMAERVISAVRV